MKLYLGCAQPPFHPQHLEIMGDSTDWVWVDLFVKHPNIKNWDAEFLSEVEDSSVEQIYASHLLEHLPHNNLQTILQTWHNKLQPGGEIILNVPDLAWAARQILALDKGIALEGYYYTWAGEHGLLSILYGSQSHAGEFHKAGFIQSYLQDLLLRAGFRDIKIEPTLDAHDMGVLIARAVK